MKNQKKALSTKFGRIEEITTSAWGKCLLCKYDDTSIEDEPCLSCAAILCKKEIFAKKDLSDVLDEFYGWMDDKLKYPPI